MTCTWSNNFQSNTGKLKLRFPQLYALLQPMIDSAFDLIKQAEQNVQVPDSVDVLNKVFNFWEFSKARDESLTAKENGVFIHSGYSPIKEVSKLFSEKTDGETAWIFAGFGLGYAPVEFCKVNKDNLIFLIEPDPGFLFASWCCLDWTPVFDHEKCVIITDTSPEQIIALLENLKAIESTKIVTQNSQTKHQEQWFKNFFTLLERNKQKQNINENTLKKFSGLWLKNSAKNLQYFSSLSGINLYKDMLKEEIPAIVCAAGPTLETVLPHLKELKNKAVIICVDTALRALLRYQIEPDFILLIDPQYYAACHIIGLKSPSSVLITESSVYPSVMRFDSRKTVLCESLFPLGKYFENKLLPEHSFGKITAGGSVSTSAWDFAKFIGAKKIYMAGLDLGYPENVTHIKGSTFEEKSHSTSSKLKSAENNLCSILFSAANEKSVNYKNETIITDSKMKLFAWWFESQLAKNPQTETFSLSDKSLKIPGMKTVSVNELLLLSDVKVKKEAAISDAEKNCSGFNQEEFSKALAELKAMLEDLYALSKKGLNLCNKILELPPIIAAQKASEEMSSLEKIDSQILNSQAKEVASLVFPTKTQLEEITQNQKKYDIPVLNAVSSSRIIYKELIKAIRQYQKYL